MKKSDPYRWLTANLKWLMTPHSPLRTMGTIAIAVFIGETTVMLILTLLPPLPVFTEAIVDSTLLIVVTSPALYLFLFRPIIRHINQREEAERSLRKNRDLLQTVFNGISDPLILLDAEARVRMINKAAGRYYRIGDRFINGQPCHVVFMAGDQPCPECDIPHRITENTSHTFERKGLFDTFISFNIHHEPYFRPAVYHQGTRFGNRPGPLHLPQSGGRPWRHDRGQQPGR
ncbi:hypothetical protein DSCO28_61940 [Desulfosarcina ovata subsp. sediminis]|uniref:PAS domain-containing protein n=1 Tax=Desulfosarcina ovata subsp. sediminis TaxID=885957 RepID=A0A5K7ZZJ4_9BACT|nr:PAS domain-containing protein [Desulfosarcina ovata]BBO85628.1 hypothetical protein DSCO28_61940 [Desulfosarcina ovata subsp. sediminis]